MKRINREKLPRRIIQYVVGVACIAFGIVLIKRTNWGVTPVSAIPDALAAFTPLSMGNAMIMMYVLCLVAVVIVQKKMTIRVVAAVAVSIGFGYLVDLFMWLWHPELNVFLTCLELLAGIAAQGFGICIVSGSDMVFPAPDELNQTIARTSGRKLSNVKIFMDILYVVIAIIMNLITMHSIVSIGISSVVSALLTGHFIRLFNKILPGAQLGPVVSE